MTFLLLPTLGVLSFLSTEDAATPEENFWTWFKSHENSLFDFESDRERTFDRLGAEIHKLNPNLTFEFGPKQNGRREFVISADGIREAFSAVEALYAAAPSVPRWKFIKFRPRRRPSDISYGGVSVSAKSVRVEVTGNGKTADLTVFIPGYSPAEHKTYAAITFLLLDEALGEYDVETRVGRVNVKEGTDPTPRSYSLEALPKAVDAHIAK